MLFQVLYDIKLVVMWLKNDDGKKNFRWMRSSLQSSVEVMELYATGPYSNLGLNNVQLNIRILYKQEKEKIILRIKSNNLNCPRKYVTHMKEKMRLETINTVRSLTQSIPVVEDWQNS